MFIWQIDQVYGGDVSKMIAKAKELGLTGVFIKFADGSLNGSKISQHYMNNFKKYAPQFKKAGFVVAGWIYQYLTDVQGEVDACTQAIQAGADWVIFNAEVEVEGKNKEAKKFGELFRKAHPDIKTGYSTFPIVQYHSKVPYSEYASFVNVMLPQIYWADMGWTLDRAFKTTLEQYKPYNLPIAPTGQIYNKAQPKDIAQFIKMCSDAKLTGISWWDWQHASADQQAAIKTSLYGSTSVVPQAPTPTPVTTSAIAPHFERYANTDLAYLKLGSHEVNFGLVWEPGKTVQQIVKKYNADFGINFPFFYRGNPVSDTVINGKILYKGTGKVEKWHALAYRVGQLDIGMYQADSSFDFLVRTSPLLVNGGKACWDYYQKYDQTAHDIGRDEKGQLIRAQRTFIGIDKNGDFIVAVSKGRDGAKNPGLTIQEEAEFMLSKGAVVALNGDGGGSSVMVGKNGVIMGSGSTTVGHALLISIQD
jgi:hypothetical protein